MVDNKNNIISCTYIHYMSLFMSINLFLLSACNNIAYNENLFPGMSNAALERYEELMRHRRPTNAIIDRVESRLAKEPCVGQLNRWERLFSYGFDMKKGKVDESVIDFMFRQAGVYDFKAGRRITSPDEWVEPDDRKYDLVSGKFFLQNGELVIEVCGPNIATKDSGNIISN